MATYSSTSPYYDTETYSNYLDVMTHREIERHADDKVYEIQEVYNLRPDLLAHDLYDDANLWWVFIVRNPNAMEDPIYDFTTGVRIFLPKQTTISAMLEV